MRNTWLIVREIVGFTGLLFLSAEDLRKKEITLWPVIGLAVLGALCSILGGDWTDASALLRFVPGLAVMLFARLSRESIGYGDGWVLLALGCFCDAGELAGLCMTAIFSAGLAGLFLLTVLRRGRQTQIPFVPFLLFGYGAGILCGILA